MTHTPDPAANDFKIVAIETTERIYRVGQAASTDLRKVTHIFCNDEGGDFFPRSFHVFIEGNDYPWAEFNADHIIRAEAVNYHD
jgi:hypothetical protein